MSGKSLLIALAVGLALTGCGSSSGASSSGRSTAAAASAAKAQTVPTAPKPAAKAGSPGAPSVGFGARADAICARLNRRLAGAFLTALVRQAGRRAATLQADARATEGELLQLRPPSRLSVEWQDVIAKRRMLAQALSARADVATGTGRGVIAARRRLSRQLSRTARASGFPHCGAIG